MVIVVSSVVVGTTVVVVGRVGVSIVVSGIGAVSYTHLTLPTKA